MVVRWKSAKRHHLKCIIITKANPHRPRRKGSLTIRLTLIRRQSSGSSGNGDAICLGSKCISSFDLEKYTKYPVGRRSPNSCIPDTTTIMTMTMTYSKQRKTPFGRPFQFTQTHSHIQRLKMNLSQSNMAPVCHEPLSFAQNTIPYVL